MQELAPAVKLHSAHVATAGLKRGAKILIGVSDDLRSNERK